jgi:transcription termination factor NusB
MWTKSFRKCLVGAIYQNLFWETFSGVMYVPNWQILVDELSKEGDEISVEDLENGYQKYLDSKEHSSKILHSYISKWDKTFDIMKAALYCFIIEYSERKNEPDLHLLGQYIKYAQDFAGGENPSLIHAIMSRMIEEGVI